MNRYQQQKHIEYIHIINLWYVFGILFYFFFHFQPVGVLEFDQVHVEAIVYLVVVGVYLIAEVDVLFNQILIIVAATDLYWGVGLIYGVPIYSLFLIGVLPGHFDALVV